MAMAWRSERVFRTLIRVGPGIALRVVEHGLMSIQLVRASEAPS